MPEELDLSIIIVSFNTKEITKNCIESIYKNLKNIKFEIIIVDNDSKDGSVDYLKKLSMNKSGVKAFFMKENLGFGRANNYGMERCGGKYILLLNSDTIVENNVIKEVIEWLEKNKKYGVATPNLYNKDGTVQGTGGYFPSLIRVFSWMTIQDLPLVDKIIPPFHPMKSNSPIPGTGFYDTEKDLDWVTGAFMMIRRETYIDVGGFDKDFFMYTEEVEYCMRIKKKGWLIRYLPLKGIIHLGGASSNVGFSVLKEFEGVKMFYKKHYPRWQYPVLRLLFKVGCFWRMLVFGALKGKGAGQIYAKAFITV